MDGTDGFKPGGIESSKKIKDGGKEKFYKNFVQKRIDIYKEQVHKHIKQEEERLAELKEKTGKVFQVNFDDFPDVNYEVNDG